MLAENSSVMNVRSAHFSGKVQVKILKGHGTSSKLIRLPQNSMLVNQKFMNDSMPIRLCLLETVGGEQS